MGVSREGEPELCEECGSPLEDGLCHNCVSGFREGASPVGAAPLDKQELKWVLGRWVGPGAHGSYTLSMQQGERMAPLRKEIELLVEQFNASPELKNSVKQNSERAAVKLLDDFGPTKAAIVGVATEFLGQGRNAIEVSSSISGIHQWIGQLSDLVIEVYLTASSDKVKLTLNGMERKFKISGEGLYRKLRVPLFVGDSNATVELKGAVLTSDGYDQKKVRPLGPTKFLLNLDERNFGLFKLLERASLSGELVADAPDSRALARRYSISKLPLTEELLREANLLPRVNAEYVARLGAKLKDGHGRSPRKLAEDALMEACSSVVPEPLRELIVEKYHLKPSSVKSLVVLPELSMWQGW